MKTRIVVLTALMAASVLAGCQGASRTNEGGDMAADTSATATGGTATSSPAVAPAAMPEEKSVLLLDTTVGRTGVWGEVWQAPITKGGNDSAALPNALITVEDMNEKVVAKVKSDARGKFFVALPPGTHLLIPEPFEPIYPAPPISQNVVVPDTGTATVIFTYKTGPDGK